MTPKWQRLAGEFSRSAIAGTISSIVAILLFNMLVHWDPGYDEPVLGAHVITGFVIANVLSTLLTLLAQPVLGVPATVAPPASPVAWWPSS